MDVFGNAGSNFFLGSIDTYFVIFGNTVLYYVLIIQIYMITAIFALFHAVLDHQIWLPIDLLALRYQLCVLETLGPFPIDTVAPIVLTGALPVLILLQAVEMAAQYVL